jgi:hypothetical protein
LSGVVIGVRIGSVTPPSTKAPSRSSNYYAARTKIMS